MLWCCETDTVQYTWNSSRGAIPHYCRHNPACCGPGRALLVLVRMFVKNQRSADRAVCNPLIFYVGVYTKNYPP